MAAVYPAAFRKEVREPQRKIAAADLRVVRADRIVRHDEAALHDVDEIGLTAFEQNAFKEVIVDCLYLQNKKARQRTNLFYKVLFSVRLITV